MLVDGILHSLQTGLNDGLGHGEVQPDIARGVAHEQSVAALQQHTSVVGEEAGQPRRLPVPLHSRCLDGAVDRSISWRRSAGHRGKADDGAGESVQRPLDGVQRTVHSVLHRRLYPGPAVPLHQPGSDPRR